MRVGAQVSVNHSQLSAFPCRFHINAFSLEAWADAVPVVERWHEYDALSVRQSSAGEAADGPVEKILVLIELHDVIAWAGARHHSIPGLTFTQAVRFTVKLRVHRNLSPIKQRASRRRRPLFGSPLMKPTKQLLCRHRNGFCCTMPPITIIGCVRSSQRHFDQIVDVGSAL